MVKSSAFKIVWDRKALDHLKEILTYLSKRSVQAPKIVKTALFHHLDALKANPLICESDKLKNPGDEDFRAFVVFSYRVTIQIKSDSREIRVLRIRHTSQEPFGY